MINNFKDFLDKPSDFDLSKLNYKSIKKEKFTSDQLKIIIGRQKNQIKRLKKENKDLKEKLSGKQLRLEI